MRTLRFQKMPYPENLLGDLGISLVPEDYPLLEEKIGTLDEKQRSTLLGRYRDNKSAQVMAKEFNCSKKTIYMRLAQGMERLKTALLPEGMQATEETKPDGPDRYHYRKLTYPENLLWDMGIDLPPDQYPLLEEKISFLDEKLRDVVAGKYHDMRTNTQMAEMFFYSAQTISMHCVRGLKVLKRMLVEESTQTAATHATQPTGDEPPVADEHPIGEEAVLVADEHPIGEEVLPVAEEAPVAVADEHPADYEDNAEEASPAADKEVVPAAEEEASPAAEKEVSPAAEEEVSPASEKEVVPVDEKGEKAWDVNNCTVIKPRKPILAHKPEVKLSELDFIKRYIILLQRLAGGVITKYLDKNGKRVTRIDDEVTGRLILDLQAEMEDTGGFITRALFGEFGSETRRVEIDGEGTWQIDFPSQLYDFLKVKKERLIPDYWVE